MREFRGKNIENHQFVYGYYAVVVEEGDNGGLGVYYKETQTPIHYISDENGNSEMVYPNTVGQYSGLKDKNNNKIFEGDKVKAYGEIYIIEFELGSFIFVRKEIVKHHTNEYRLNWRFVSNNAGDYREWEECRNNYEVIENIYKEQL